MPAGYSGTPLAKKLGIKPGHRLLLAGAPSGFEDQLEGLPDDVKVLRRTTGSQPYDVILAFCQDERALKSNLAKLRKRLDPGGGLWIAWPKKSAGVATDLDGNLVRKRGLATGLVDNKVCAVDETWSGLRFVVRLKDR